MNNTFDSLYHLYEGYIILPSELIQNAKLPNYEYVKFTSSDEGLYVEACCVLEDSYKALFYYNFDKNDQLLRMVSIIDGVSEIVFDRELEKLKMKEILIKEMSNSSVQV